VKVGNGSTAAAVRHERATGGLVSERTHTATGAGLRALPRSTLPPLAEIAASIAGELETALARFRAVAARLA